MYQSDVFFEHKIMPPLYYSSLFILGLIFGSFVSAISWRIPRGISFVRGRSICPKCKRYIRWYDNIPFFSYLFLGGRCRNCKKKISVRYPLIELFTAIGFVLIFYPFKGLPLQGVYSIWQMIFLLAIFLILLTIFVIDLENQIIPDSLVFTGIGFVFLYSLFFIHNSFFSTAFSGFLSASFLLLIHLVTKGRGMGLGDVKFAIFGGMITGLKLMPVWLFLSFLTGAVTGIILILVGRAKMKTKIAFGPFLVLGIGLALLFGNNILEVTGLI